MLHMVMVKRLYFTSSVLLDPDIEYPPPNISVYTGEVNSGTWMKEAIAKVCTL